MQDGKISVEEDAFELAKIIHPTMIPGEKSGVFNVYICKRREAFSPPVPKGFKKPSVYGYSYDLTIFLLEKLGVIEAKSPQKWYICTSSDKSDPKINEYDKELVSLVAREKGYLEPDLHFVLIFLDYPDGFFQGHFSILVNKLKLEDFIRLHGDIKNREELSPQEMGYWYSSGQLKFRLSNGEVDQFDFSKADLSRKVFESFWNLWKGDGEGKYSKEQIIDEYKKSFGTELESGRIGEIISNIRASIIYPKKQIKNRLVWKFNRKNQKWLFRPQSLKD